MIIYDEIYINHMRAKNTSIIWRILDINSSHKNIKKMYNYMRQIRIGPKIVNTPYKLNQFSYNHVIY